MQSVIPPGDPARTVIAGKAQGFLGLAINYGVTEDTSRPGVPQPTMVTAWEPSPDELAALNNGAKVIVQILGMPPIRPMAVFVGEPQRQIECGCGVSLEFDADEQHIRCFVCGAYHHPLTP